MSNNISIGGRGIDLSPKKSISVVLTLLKIEMSTGATTELFTGTDVPVIPVTGDVTTAPDGTLYQVFQREVSFEVNAITQERIQRVICGCAPIAEILKRINKEEVTS